MSKHKPSWKKRPEEGDYTASLNRLCAACYADEDAPVAAIMVAF